MNNRVLAGIVVVIVVIVIAAVAVVGFGGGDREGVTTGVNYHGNGGLTSDGEEVFGLTSTEVSTNMFTYEDMVFVDWNTEQDGSGTWYDAGDTISYGDGTVDLYAQWAYGFSVGYSYIGPIGYDWEVILVDSSGQGRTVTGLDTIALPSDGKAGILVLGAVNGTVWTFDEDTVTFSGTSDVYEYEVRLVLDGADTVTDLSQENSCVLGITFDSPVTGHIFISEEHV